MKYMTWMWSKGSEIDMSECRLLSVICNNEKDWCDTYCCKCEEISNCDHKQLQTAKEENENLKKLIRKLAIDKIEFDRLKRNETDKVDYSFGQIETLTQQNKQMREALKEIVECIKSTGIDVEKLDYTIEAEILSIAQQALKGVKQVKKYTYKELTEIIIPAIKRTIYKIEMDFTIGHKIQFWESKLKKATKQLINIIEKREAYKWMMD